MFRKSVSYPKQWERYGPVHPETIYEKKKDGYSYHPLNHLTFIKQLLEMKKDSSFDELKRRIVFDYLQFKTTGKLSKEQRDFWGIDPLWDVGLAWSMSKDEEANYRKFSATPWQQEYHRCKM